jgi:glycosyltransferase involved in cell wall biosynthesis
MTPSISLKTWSDNGSIARELFLYKRYRQAGWDVYILTCDNPESLPEIPLGLNLITGCWPLKGRFHLLNYLSPFNLKRTFQAMAVCDIIKTNQSVGAWFYAVAARIVRKPLLLRCGWLPGRYLTNAGLSHAYLAVLRFFEGIGMRMADVIEVATESDRFFITEKYNVPKEKIRLFPNWIDTGLFSPEGSIEKIPRSVVSVGRLTPVKRFDLLIDACSTADVSLLTLVGEGPDREELRRRATGKNINVRFLGAQPQSALPGILRQHEVFALTSKAEGHPKALLEAMACAMPCIGTDVQGTNEVIVDGENGVLCTSTTDGIAAAIKRLFDNRSDAAYIGKNARMQVVEKCDFEILFNRERTLLDSLYHAD